VVLVVVVVVVEVQVVVVVELATTGHGMDLVGDITSLLLGSTSPVSFLLNGKLITEESIMMRNDK